MKSQVGHTPGEVTRLLAGLQKGDEAAASKLVALVYPEMRRIARYYMRAERRNHTLTPTALVHEAYLRLAGQPGSGWRDRAHFFGVAANLMRRILVDHARAPGAAKRGGVAERVPFEEAVVVPSPRSEDLVALDDALQRLEKENPRQSRIVELRFFAGLSIEEIAEVLNVAERTVKRDWAVARAWLYSEVANQP